MIRKNENEAVASCGKISEALELLNEAAREKKDELKDMFTDKYAHIKEVIAVDAQKVAGRVRKDPWPYLAGTAAVALLLGYLMGKRK